MPNEFLLGQNYPNPFNPLTKIKFKIPYSSQVTLTVYDILGKEIAALINEPLAQGNYETIFDGSSLSGGIYFYKIQADKFVQTKKLVLLK